MTDVNTDSFGEHESRPDEPMGKIFLLPKQGDQLGTQDVNKKHCLEEEKVNELDS